MVISLVIAGILAIAIFTVTFYYYANVAQAQAASDLGLESQSILAQMTEDIRLADAISSNNQLNDSHAPGGGWVTSDPSGIIIIESPATDSSRNIIYDNDTGFPYRNEYIYFLSGSSLYKRILANPDAPGNTAVTTCPAASSGPSCPPDRLFSSHVNKLSFTFYDSSHNTTADASSARSILLEVDLAKKAFGKNVTLTNSTNVTMRNR